MKSLACRLGIHSTDFISIVYDLDTEILPGSKAAIVSQCKCGKTSKILGPVPVYTIKYKLPENYKEKEEESNG